MIEVTDYLLFSRYGEIYSKFYQSVIAKHLDVTVVGSYNGLCNGKAQAVMLVLSTSGRIHTVESLKDFVPVFRGDLIAGVDYRKLCNTMIPGQRQTHFTGRLAVPNRVIQQNRCQLLQLGAIALYRNPACNSGA